MIALDTVVTITPVAPSVAIAMPSPRFGHR